MAASSSSGFQRFMAATSSTVPRQCLSASVLFATGDVIAQQAIEKRGSNHDGIRTLRLATYGGALFAPLMSRWFGVVLEKVQMGSKAKNVATKVALDQLIASPFMTGFFFTATTLMEGKSISDAKAKVKENWWPTYKAACTLWAPVQVINMALVPPTQRLLVVNVVSVAWNTFLSAQAAGGNKETKTAESSLEAKVEGALKGVKKEVGL